MAAARRAGSRTSTHTSKHSSVAHTKQAPSPPAPAQAPPTSKAYSCSVGEISGTAWSSGEVVLWAVPFLVLGQEGPTLLGPLTTNKKYRVKHKYQACAPFPHTTWYFAPTPAPLSTAFPQGSFSDMTAGQALPWTSVPTGRYCEWVSPHHTL